MVMILWCYDEKTRFFGMVEVYFQWLFQALPVAAYHGALNVLFGSGGVRLCPGARSTTPDSLIYPGSLGLG